MRTLEWDDVEIMVVNCGGSLFAMEDRCSHDDGPLAEGLIDPERCTVECPRHGSLFDLRSGRRSRCPPTSPSRPTPCASRTGSCASRWSDAEPRPVGGQSGP